MDNLGLEQAVDGFGERIVIAVADAADRGLDAGIRKLNRAGFPGGRFV